MTRRYGFNYFNNFLPLFCLIDASKNGIFELGFLTRKSYGLKLWVVHIVSKYVCAIPTILGLFDHKTGDSTNPASVEVSRNNIFWSYKPMHAGGRLCNVPIWNDAFSRNSFTNLGNLKSSFFSMRNLIFTFRFNAFIKSSWWPDIHPIPFFHEQMVSRQNFETLQFLFCPVQNWSFLWNKKNIRRFRL